VAAWTTALAAADERAAPGRIALLRAGSDGTASDGLLVEDLVAFGGDLLHLRPERDTAAQALLELLARNDPTVLVVPSAHTIRWLERAQRAPIERALPQLRLLLAEHDLGQPLRSRVELRGAGWFHAAGRIALPRGTGRGHALTLAHGSAVLELLPHGDPEADGRRGFAAAAILPEHAVIGGVYELVVTSETGSLRERTGEHLRVLGFDPPLPGMPWPRARAHRLAPPPADVALEGYTVPGAWLTACVRQAFRREDPALVAAAIGPDAGSVPVAAAGGGSLHVPEAFADTELDASVRGARPAAARPHGLRVRVELQGQPPARFAEQLGQRIDLDLQRRAPAYAHLRGRGELERVRVTIVEAGTWARDAERRVRRFYGAVGRPDVRVTGPLR
jgi:hypothetical protein